MVQKNSTTKTKGNCTHDCIISCRLPVKFLVSISPRDNQEVDTLPTEEVGKYSSIEMPMREVDCLLVYNYMFQILTIYLYYINKNIKIMN